jgi:lipopolysaccharide export system protein LptA
VVNQGRSQFKGTKAEIDLKRGVSRLLAGSSGDGRVHTVIQPKKNSSGDAAPVTPGTTTQ